MAQNPVRSVLQQYDLRPHKLAPTDNTVAISDDCHKQSHNALNICCLTTYPWQGSRFKFFLKTIKFIKHASVVG